MQVCATRETPFLAIDFRFRAYHFHNAKRSGSVPVLATGQSAFQPDASYKSAPRRPQFHARNPLQSPTFSSWSSLRTPPPPPHVFYLPWHVPTKLWGECPPPPPPGHVHSVSRKLPYVALTGRLYVGCDLSFNSIP